ncbi:hypothetical protein ACJW30_09G139200 [Castanea mollissima]
MPNQKPIFQNTLFLLLSLSLFNNVAIVHTIEPCSNSESFNSFPVEIERATTPNQTQQKAKIQNQNKPILDSERERDCPNLLVIGVTIAPSAWS